MQKNNEIAYFDFDDTIVWGDTILYWNAFLFRKHPLLRFWRIFFFFGLLLYACRIIRSPGLKRLMLVPTGRISEERREILAKEFAREHLPGLFYPEVLERMENLQREGVKVILASASPDFYLKYLDGVLPVDEIYGTEMVFSKGLFGIPSYKEANFKGEQKVVFLKEHQKDLGTNPGVIGFSDHHSDRFLLDYCESGVVVNPTEEMTSIARKRGWEILSPNIPYTGIKKLFIRAGLFLLGRNMPRELK